MASVEVTGQNFDQLIDENEVIILDFWAPWCGPCKNFAPIFEAASEKYKDVLFGKINTDEQTDLAAEFEVRSIPTVVAAKQGTIVFSQAGVLSADVLGQLVEAVKAANLDELEEDNGAESKDEV